MPCSCVVKGCKNVSGRAKDVQLHRLPIKQTNLLREYLKRAGKTENELAAVTEKQCRSWRICSSHFESDGGHTMQQLPTKNIPGTPVPLSTSEQPEVTVIQSTVASGTSQITAETGRDALVQARSKRKLFKTSKSQVTPIHKKLRTKALQKTPPVSRYTDITPKTRSSTQSNTELKITKDTQTEIPSKLFIITKNKTTQTCIEVSTQSVQAVLEELLKADDKELKKYTCIEDYKLFQIIHKYLVSACSDPNCSIPKHSEDPAKVFAHVSTENQLLLVLYKLKRNPVDSLLASEFGVSTGRISEIFKYWIQRMYRKFKIIKIWPSQQNVLKHMPSTTKQHFPDLMAMSDCVEFSTQTPRGPVPAKLLFSNYKNCHTVKAMYTTAPNGALIHCSDVYGGNASDKEIFAQIDISSRLKPHDGLMTDKGFLIRDCLQGKDITLYRPPYLSEKNRQFDYTERDSGRLISRSRIVVENFNSRLSFFAFLKQKKIHVLYLPLMNEISFVCGFLANLGPLIRKTPTQSATEQDNE